MYLKLNFFYPSVHIRHYRLPNKSLGREIKPYVLNNFPDIKRGDALELDHLFGYPGRKGHFMYWDGKNVIPQCNDYYDYDGGGPPLCFKTFTEFPMDYFSETAFFGSSVYLDYDTFVEQVRNWIPEYDSDDEGEDEDEDEDDAQLFIRFQDKKYSLDLCEADGNYSVTEYIKVIKRGEAKHIMLVNSQNRIVDIHGIEVYDDE